MSAQGWIGVDLDGTLAEWGPGRNEDVRRVGAPIAPMVARVKRWLAEGKDVRIFTARVGPATDEECRLQGCDTLAVFVACQHTLIAAWCQEHLGQVLPVTATKNFRMVEFWDDRCVQVRPNEGLAEVEHLGGLVDKLVAASVEAWGALGYGPASHPNCTLAGAIRSIVGTLEARR